MVFTVLRSLDGRLRRNSIEQEATEVTEKSSSPALISTTSCPFSSCRGIDPFP